ncbi:hypothetical protein KAU11_02620, partial [Candidatus Babeliales bacterium]|nr:hypothetical protein [Candidatus Babeliales bacterium]
SMAGERLAQLEGCQFEHGGDLFGFAWSPNNNYLALVGKTAFSVNVRVFVFDGIKLEEVWNVSTSGDAYCVDWSPNGKFLAVGTVDAGVGLAIYAFDALEVSQVDVVALAWDVYSVRWSQDSRYIACGGYSASSAHLNIYGFNSFVLDEVIAQTDSDWRHVDSVDWSSDGNYLFVGYADDASWTNGVIEAYRFDGSRLDSLRGCKLNTVGGVEHLAKNPVYPIVSVISKGSPAIQTWYFDSGGKAETLNELEGTSKTFLPGFSQTSWSPDGRFLAVVGEYNSGDTSSGYVYEFLYGSLVERAKILHGSHIFDVGWHPNGKCLAISGDDGTDSKNIRIFSFNGFDLTELSGCAITRTTENLYGLSWHSSGNYLAVVGYDNLLKCYWFSQESLTEIASYDASVDLRSVTWHPGGTLLAISGNSVLRILKFDGTSINSTPVASHTVADWVYDVAWSSDGTYLAFCGGTSLTYDFQVLAFSGSALTEPAGARLSISSNSLYSVKWGWDDRYLFVSGAATTDGYNTESYSLIDETFAQRSNACVTIGGTSMGSAVSPNFNYLTLVSDGSPTDGCHLHINPIEDGKTLQDLQENLETTESVIEASFSKLEERVTANSYAIVTLKINADVDLQGYQDSALTSSNIVTDVSVNAVDWSSDGKYVAIGTDDVRGGHHIQIFLADGSSLLHPGTGVWDLDLGTTTTIKDLEWHPHGTHLAVAAETIPEHQDGEQPIVHEVRVFELLSTGLNELIGGCRLGTGSGSSVETFESISWSPDGRLLAAAGYSPSDQCKIYAFDHAHTLTVLESVTIDYGSSTTVYSVDWQTTGSYSTIALAGEDNGSGDKIQLYAFDSDLLSADSYRTFILPWGHYGECETRYGVAWSPDGTKLASVGGQGGDGSEVMSFNFHHSSGLLHHVGNLDFTHGGTVKTAAWSPDSTKLAITGYTGVDSAHSRVLELKNNGKKFEDIAECYQSDEKVPVKYGDVITLKHVNTGNFLASSFYEWWQSFMDTSDATWFIKQTSCVVSESIRTKWIVKGVHAASERWNCRFGLAVEHGDTIRLESVFTRGNLFSDNIYLPPVSSPLGSYHWVTARYNFSSGEGADSSGDDFVIAINGGSSGDPIMHGDVIRFQHNDYNTYYLYSQDVTFFFEEGGSDYEQEVATSTLSDDNRDWVISAVDSQGYRDVVDGGLHSGAGRSVVWDPTGLSLLSAGAPDGE